MENTMKTRKRELALRKIKEEADTAKQKADKAGSIPGLAYQTVAEGVPTMKRGIMAGANKLGDLIRRRKKAQENWRNRPDNSNYTGSWTDFEDKK